MSQLRDSMSAEPSQPLAGPSSPPARKRPRKAGSASIGPRSRNARSSSRADGSAGRRQSSIASSRQESLQPGDPSGGQSGTAGESAKTPSASAIDALYTSGMDAVSVFDFLHHTGSFGAGPSQAGGSNATNKRKKRDGSNIPRFGSVGLGGRLQSSQIQLDDEFGAGFHARSTGTTGRAGAGAAAGAQAAAEEAGREKQQAADEFDLDLDAEFEEEQKLADKRWREAQAHIAEIRDHMDADQLARYDMAFNDHTKTIQPNRINEFLQSRFGYEVSRDLAMVISILAKTHVGEMVERARRIQTAQKIKGPLTPDIIRQARQEYLQDVHKSEKGIGTRPKKKLFGGLM